MRSRVSRPAAAAFAVAALTLAGASPARAPEQAPGVVVYRLPTCGCCAKWAEHLTAAGFAVEVHDVDDVEAIKDRHGVPAALRSCHTAVVNGYVIEGHVPADLIKRFLAARPAAAGLAVPGMPMGSPGMEGPRKDAYAVIAFDRQGKTTVYQRR